MEAYGWTAVCVVAVLFVLFIADIVAYKRVGRDMRRAADALFLALSLLTISVGFNIWFALNPSLIPGGLYIIVGILCGIYAIVNLAAAFGYRHGALKQRRQKY